MNLDQKMQKRDVQEAITKLYSQFDDAYCYIAEQVLGLPKSY